MVLLGCQLTNRKINPEFRKASINDCQISAQTPRPLKARIMAIIPDMLDEIIEAYAWILKFNSRLIIALGTTLKELKIIVIPKALKALVRIGS